MVFFVLVWKCMCKNDMQVNEICQWWYYNAQTECNEVSSNIHVHKRSSLLLSNTSEKDHFMFLFIHFMHAKTWLYFLHYICSPTISDLFENLLVHTSTPHFCVSLKTKIWRWRQSFLKKEWVYVCHLVETERLLKKQGYKTEP